MTVPEAAPGAAIDFHRYPDANGHFGRYGGRFVAETLVEEVSIDGMCGVY